MNGSHKSALTAVRARDAGELRRILHTGVNPDRSDKDGFTPLMEAVVTGQLEAAQLLIASGADVRAKDNRGWTALHYAAQDYQSEIAELLLENGADVDACDSFGNTPLWRAVFASRGRRDVIDVLVRYGANKHLENTSGISPQSLANSIANFPVAAILASRL